MMPRRRPEGSHMSHLFYRGVHAGTSRESRVPAAAGWVAAAALTATALVLTAAALAPPGRADIGARTVTTSVVTPAHRAAIIVPAPYRQPRAQRALHAPASGRGVADVRPGDTLSSISQRFYGTARCWPGIYRGNQRVIGGDYNLIAPGQHLMIPTSCSSTAPRTWAATARPVRSGDTEPDGDGDDVRVTSARAPINHGAGSSGSGRALTPSGNLSFRQLEVLWELAGGPAWAGWSAASIAECESGGQQYAYNSSGASGYWQILGQVVFTGRSLFDALTNALNAVAKFRASGNTFAQWVCRA